VSSGLKPPCMQIIFSSMSAKTGKQLKASVNAFHNLMLYLLLPVFSKKKKKSQKYKEKIKEIFNNFWKIYIRHKTHKFCWLRNTHDFLSKGKSSQGIWFYKPKANKLSLSFVFLCPRNHPKISNLTREGNHHIQRVSINRNIDHECHLGKNEFMVLKARTTNFDGSFQF